MDAAERRRLLESCGTCGQPEDAHKHHVGTDSGDVDLFAALGGACSHFTVSDAAVIYEKHVAIVTHRTPRRQPNGRLGKRLPLCSRCGRRHPRVEDCPI